MTSIQLGLEDFAKYPFLKEAGEEVKQYTLDINDLLQDDFKNIILRARTRVLEASNKKRISTEINEPSVELLSFPIALILVKATQLDHLASQYAYAEAVRVEHFLEGEKDIVVAEMFRNVLDIHLHDISLNSYGYGIYDFKISIASYLTRASKFHELHWKLINRVVDEGDVYLTKHDLIRLIRNEIKNIILEKINVISIPKLPERMEEIVKEIVSTSPRPQKFMENQLVTPDKYPPCVLHAIKMLEQGDNLPHYGRFLLGTYLLSIGKNVDNVIELYSGAPDFNERITRYQVEHLAGLKGSRTRYKVPTCRTLKTHSFCFKVAACDSIRSPLQFGMKQFFVKKGKIGQKNWTKRQH